MFPDKKHSGNIPAYTDGKILTDRAIKQATNNIKAESGVSL